MAVEKVLSVKEVKPENRYIRTESSGQWILQDDVIYWKKTTTTLKFDVILHDWIKTDEKVEMLTPQDSPFKLAKTMDVDVILLREKSDDESASGTTILCYLRKVNIKVKEGNPNVWLTLGDNGKVFVKDLLKMFTYCFSLMSDERVSCVKLSEKRIDTETAKTIKTGYVFSKFEKLDSDTEIYGQFVKPS